jgi:hypothetical protein
MRATLPKRAMVGKAAVGVVLGVVAAVPPSLPRSKTPPVKGGRAKRVRVARGRDRVDPVSKKFR